MITFQISRDDALRTRFALSPLHEMQWAVEVVRDPSRRSIHLPWARWAAPRAEPIAHHVDVLHAMVAPPGYAPDFMAPPPESPLPDVDEELARVAATPPATAARELGWRFAEIDPSPVAQQLMADPTAGIERIVRAQRAVWDVLLAPVWGELRAVLEADVLHHARRLADAGAEALFADLHPRVKLDDGTLSVESRYDADVDLRGRGLLLVPVAFAWPDVYVMLDEPWQPAVLYAPRGVGELWSDERSNETGALDELIGSRRAAILKALPGATNELAARLNASAAGVSQHLGILRRAGLVRSARIGRRVVYERTPAGDAMIRS
jgi:DNA-binding transcriptional ArsR family regulator